MNELTILVPVLNRPHHVRPVLDSALGVTPGAAVLFIADLDDTAEIDALESEGADWITVDGGYAKKINQAVKQTDSPFLFTAADDLVWRDGWFEAAVDRMREAGAAVAGVNDLRPRPTQHATHFLMTREYAETPVIDGGEGPFYEGYTHNYCDRELIDTARKRGEYVYVAESWVEHKHHLDGAAPHDETYILGEKSFREDTVRYRQRRHLWA